MTILITGAAGFIGSHASEALIAAGHSVIGVDNFDNFYPRNIKEQNLSVLKQSDLFHFFESDIRDSSAWDRIFSHFEVDAVIHLAAKVGVRPSIENISEYFDVNMNGTITLLEAMRKHDVRKMLFASSSSVYGNNTKVPFAESDFVDNPISPYASTKKSGELLCHVYYHLYDFDITCLRFFTVYGPRQRPDLAIHKFTRRILQGRPISFYGDGNTSRDYTYIDDIVNGIKCALAHLNGHHIYNLGESHVVTLSWMLKTIESILNKKAVLELLPLQPGDVTTTYADISKARTEIEYNPQISFEEGITRFAQWFYENKEVLVKYE